MPLTVENSGAAIVAGAPLPKKTRRVRVVRAFMAGGQIVAVDEELVLPAPFASELVAGGKAAYLPDEPAPAAALATTTKAAKAAKDSHAQQ